MIKCIKKHNDTTISEYIVYENEEEFANACIAIVKLEECKAGDYVKTDNGYFIPVIHRRSHRRLTAGKISYMVTIEFPANYIYTNLLYGDSNKFRQKVFKWSRDEKVNTKQKFVDARMKLMAYYLSQGMDIYLAFEIVYSKYKSRSKLEQVLSMILEDENFKKHMKETGIMANLQQEMKAIALDNKLIAKKLKEIIDDPTSPQVLLKFAIETVITLNERVPANITTAESNPVKRNFNEIIGEKVIGNLKTG